MRLRLTFSLLMLLSFSSIVAQTTFEKTYGISAIDEATSVRQTIDGGFIVGGTLLIKTDSFGNEEWSQPIPSNFANVTADGGYILVDDDSQTITFTKVTSIGDTAWQSTFSGGIWANEGNYIEQIADGGYIVTGRFQSVVGSGMLLLRLDDQGNHVWQRAYTEPTSAGFNDGFSVQQTADMGFLIAGRTNIDYYDSTAHQEVMVVKTDTNGVAQWKRYFGGLEDDAAFFVRQAVDGNYFVGGITNSFGPGVGSNMYLIKLDTLGDSLWTKTYGGNFEESANAIWPTTDGGCVLAGSSNTFSNGDFDGYIVKVDTDGNEQWTKHFGGTELDLFNSIQQTADNGFIVAGYTNSFGSTDNHIYVVKTDSLGEVQSTSTTNSLPSSPGIFKVYPNPTNSSFSVKFEGKTSDWHQLQLTTIEGYLIKTVHNKGLSNRTISFHPDRAGIYFLRVVTGTGITTQKIVVTK